MPQPAYTRTAILQMLAEHGPMSTDEIAAEMGLSEAAIRAAIVKSRQKYGTRFFRVAQYRLHRGRSGRPKPVYATGPSRDVKPPEFGDDTLKQAQERYRERHRAVLRLKTTQRRHGAVNPFLALVRHT